MSSLVEKSRCKKGDIPFCLGRGVSPVYLAGAAGKKGGDSFERSGIQENRSQYSGHDMNDVRDVSQNGLGKVRWGT